MSYKSEHSIWQDELRSGHKRFQRILKREEPEDEIEVVSGTRLLQSAILSVFIFVFLGLIVLWLT